MFNVIMESYRRENYSSLANKCLSCLKSLGFSGYTTSDLQDPEKLKSIANNIKSLEKEKDKISISEKLIALFSVLTMILIYGLGLIGAITLAPFITLCIVVVSVTVVLTSNTKSLKKLESNCVKFVDALSMLDKKYDLSAQDIQVIKSAKSDMQSIILSIHAKIDS